MNWRNHYTVLDTGEHQCNFCEKVLPGNYQSIKDHLRKVCIPKQPNAEELMAEVGEKRPYTPKDQGKGNKVTEANAVFDKIGKATAIIFPKIPPDRVQEIAAWQRATMELMIR